MSKLHSLSDMTRRWNSDKIWGLVLVILIILSILTGFWVTQWRVQNADKQIRQELLLQVSAIAQTINPEQIKTLSYTLADQKNPVFQRLHQQMQAYASTFGYRTIYTMAKRNQQIVFGPDNLKQSDPLYSPTGTVYQQPPPELEKTFQKPQRITIGPYKDEYSEFITAYAPVVDPDTGQVLMVVGMDIEKTQWQKQISQLKLLPFLFTLILLALILGNRIIVKQLKQLPLGEKLTESYLTAIFCLVLTISISLIVYENEFFSHQRTFTQVAETRAASITHELWDIQDHYLFNLTRFFEANEQVTRSEFYKYTHQMIPMAKVPAWGWFPVVKNTEKEKFEQKARQQGLEDFFIFQRDKQGNKVPVVGRDVYYPIFYIEPVTTSKNVLGYDLGSEPVRRAALLEAIRTKLPTATKIMTLIHHPKKPQGIVIYNAIFKAGQPESLVGVALSLQQTLSETLAQSGYGDTSVFVDWLEIQTHKPPEILARIPHEPFAHKVSVEEIIHNKTKYISSIYPVFVFGKAYALIISPGDAFLEANPLRSGWITMFMGLVLTTIITILVAFVKNRRILLEQQVQIRTAQLRETTQQLNKRVKEMRCLIALSQLCQQPDITREKLLQECVQLLPPAWHYPESTCAKICFNKEVYLTTNYAPTLNLLSADIVVNNHCLGTVQVYLTQDLSFLNEEEDMIHTVAQFLSNFIEQSQAEEALRKNEQRFRHISSTISDIAYSCSNKFDGNCSMDWLTGAVKTITGYDISEIISRRCWSFLILEEDLPHFQESVIGLQPGNSAQCELRLRHKDGSIIWVSSFSECVKESENDENIHIYGALIDITERKLAEDKLKQSEINYRQIFNSVNEAIFIHEATTGDILDVNESMLRMYGYSDKEKVKTEIFDNFSVNEPPYTRQNAEDWLRKAFLEGPQVFEWLAKNQKREKFWVEVSLRVCQISGQECVLAVVRDISERKQQEQKIKNLTRLYATLSQVNQAIFKHKEQQSLFQSICEIAVAFGRFSLVWIGLIDFDSKEIKPVAVAGENTDYLKNINISTQDIPSGRGPTGIAAREARLVISEDIKHDSKMKPWQDRALKVGYHSSAALPIKQGEIVIGVLNFYSQEVGFFTADEQTLLEEIGDNISFALDAMKSALEQQQAEQKLRENEERLRLALEAANQGLYDLNIQTGEALVSPEYATMLGYDPVQFQESHAKWIERLHPDDRASVPAIYRAYINGETPLYQAEFRQQTASGDWKWILSLGKILEWDSLGKPLRMLGTHTDITERKQAEAQVEHLAYYDPLTTLPNRRLLFDRLENALSLAKRSGNYGAVLFVDLDRFKTLNDARGHEVGDRLLKEVALRLKNSLRQADTVARFGGDEFIILLPELSDEQEISARLSLNIGDKIHAQMSNPFIFEGEEIIIGASIGITLFPKATETVNDLLKEADTAMYQAKASGRNTARLFETKMQIEVESRFALEGEIRRALEQNQFCIHLQPQVDFQGSIVGAEALIRWQHPTRGMIPPSAFIPVAEETGLIIAMGEWVLQQTCNYLAYVQAIGSLLHLSANVSPRQFRQPTFISTVKSIIANTGVDPTHLTLEVTEGLIIEDIHVAIATMSDLQTLGIHFSIDDFGTGYSSLAYLKRLPLNELKIDKSFVQDAPTDPNDAALVEVIISIARHFNLAIVAEGVETQQQADFLKVRGCNFYQGYLYGKPVPMSEFNS